MPRRDPHSPLDPYLREVELMLADGVPFDQIEGSIDATELAPDDKAALWLLAWSLEAPQLEEASARPALRLVTTQPHLEFGGTGA